MIEQIRIDGARCEVPGPANQRNCLLKSDDGRLQRSVFTCGWFNGELGYLEVLAAGRWLKLPCNLLQFTPWLIGFVRRRCATKCCEPAISLLGRLSHSARLDFAGGACLHFVAIILRIILHFMDTLKFNH